MLEHMKIGILGTGNLGRAIGTRLSEVGFDVFFGARRGEEARFAQALTDWRGHAGTNESAAHFGDILFWMMRERDPARVFAAPAALDGKIVVDVNNRSFRGEADENPWFDRSLGEELLDSLPNSRVIKALTTTSMFTFDMPVDELRDNDAQAFIAGADEDAKHHVSELLRAVGLRPVDVGCGKTAFRALEALGDVTRLMIGNGTMPANGQISITTLPGTRLDRIGGFRPSSYVAGSH